MQYHRLAVISGTISLQISFLVAFSQLVPAHTVTLFRGLLSLRVPRFPLLYIGIVAVLSLTPILSRAALWLAIFGFLTSWTYLRFYKAVFPDLESDQPASLRGDSSETFAFAEFFPAPAKPIVAAFTDQVFNILVAVRICTPFAHGDTRLSHGDAVLQRGTPGSARAEAERRRAIALKALDQRLQTATASQGSRHYPQPSMPPTAHTKSQTSTQTAVRSEPGPMLGETTFDPDHEDESHRS